MNSKIKVKHLIGIQWTIAEARLQEIRNSIGGCLKSETFDIPGTDVQYVIRIYPNAGKEDKYQGKTWIFLYLDFKEKKEIKAEFTISIETANFITKIEHVYKKSKGWGSLLGTIDEVFDLKKRFIVNGFMVIKVEGFLEIEKEAPKEPYKFGENGNSLGMNLWNQGCKDFTIVVDGKEIMAHKLILQVCSPVFSAMFQPHTQEAQENKVTIPDFSYSIVKTAIKLCYDSRLVKDMPLEDQILLLQFFDKYDIQSLKTDLENYMITVMDESNVCRLANCSLISNASNLQEKCGELLQKCFRDHQFVTDFDMLDKDFALDIVKNLLYKISA